MSTLTRCGIIERLNDKPEDRLIVTPLLDSKGQIGDASIDVRLGNQFIIFRTHTLGSFNTEHLRENLMHVQERHIVPFGSGFVLHPGMLALGATFEYVSIPADIECQVEGRSSWARVGLQIATANSVEPLFKGVLTLELSNVGTVPLQLYPGVRIAQLIFHDALPKRKKSKQSKKGKYHLAIGPEFSKAYEDPDIEIFRSKLFDKS